MSKSTAPVGSIDYEELEVEIGRSVSGKGEVRILSSRFDRPRERFRPGYDLADLNGRLEELDALMLEPAEGGIGTQRNRLAESIGIDLYEALFPGGIHRTLDRSLARLQTLRDGGNAAAGLRIRLGFSDLADDASEVVGLPWELVCDRKTRVFLGAASATPLVRYLDLSLHAKAMAVVPPLRILAVMAAPHGLPPIDLEAHRQILETACAGQRRLDLEFLEPPTVPHLRDTLAQAREEGKPFHTIHFLGHGGFDPDGRGFLNFEDELRNRARTPGQDLARLLNDFSELRLVVLATCVGARMARHQGQHPFTGSASALVAGGLPAVVAMQFPVSEQAARHFTGAFYRHVAVGRPLEEAVTEGRMSILSRTSQSIEWASPVLFLRARSGQVFVLEPIPNSGTKPEPKKESETNSPSPVEPQMPTRVLTVIGNGNIQVGGSVGGDVNNGGRRGD